LWGHPGKSYVIVNAYAIEATEETERVAQTREELRRKKIENDNAETVRSKLFYESKRPRGGKKLGHPSAGD